MNISLLTVRLVRGSFGVKVGDLPDFAVRDLFGDFRGVTAVEFFLFPEDMMMWIGIKSPCMLRCQLFSSEKWRNWQQNTVVVKFTE